MEQSEYQQALFKLTDAELVRILARAEVLVKTYRSHNHPDLGRMNDLRIALLQNEVARRKKGDPTPIPQLQEGDPVIRWLAPKEGGGATVVAAERTLLGRATQETLQHTPLEDLNPLDRAERRLGTLFGTATAPVAWKELEAWCRNGYRYKAMDTRGRRLNSPAAKLQARWLAKVANQAKKGKPPASTRKVNRVRQALVEIYDDLRSYGK